MMQMVIETYCAEIEGLKQKLEERDRKIAKLEYVNEKLHTLTDLQEANVNIMHENTMKLRKEIERLTKESDETFDRHAKENRAASILIEKRDNEIAELQKQVEKLDLANYELEKRIADLKIEHKKQVDELKERAKIDLENEKNWGKIQTRQAVKDTAKEIFTEVLSLCKNAREKLSIMFSNKQSGYGEGYKNSVEHFTENILEIAKKKGVEVE